MSDISPIGSQSPVVSRLGGGRASTSTAESTGRTQTDSVELSETARLLAKMAELPEVRIDLVERVKAEIEAGTYETSDKIDGAIDGLGEDLA